MSATPQNPSPLNSSPLTQGPFTPEQQQYLQGFVAGADAARLSRGLPTFASVLGTTSQAHRCVNFA